MHGVCAQSQVPGLQLISFTMDSLCVWTPGPLGTGTLAKVQVCSWWGPGPHQGWHKVPAPSTCCSCQGPGICQMKSFPLILLMSSSQYCLSGLFSLPFHHLNNDNTDVTETKCPPRAAGAFVALCHGHSSGWCPRRIHRPFPHPLAVWEAAS